jgi:selenocysteine lyase/cysteine desulfurase
MADASVFVSVRGDAMRVSPHVYNDADDIDRLFEVLRETL